MGQVVGFWQISKGNRCDVCFCTFWIKAELVSGYESGPDFFLHALELSFVCFSLQTPPPPCKQTFFFSVKIFSKIADWHKIATCFLFKLTETQVSSTFFLRLSLSLCELAFYEAEAGVAVDKVIL